MKGDDLLNKEGSGSTTGLGPLGECLCSNCGKSLQPSVRQPCYSMKCPECGSSMKKRS